MSNNWYSSLFNFAVDWYLLSPISLALKPSVWTADESLRATEMGFCRAPWLFFFFGHQNASSLIRFCLSANSWMIIHIYTFIIHYSCSGHGNKSVWKLWWMWNSLSMAEQCRLDGLDWWQGNEERAAGWLYVTWSSEW